MTGHWFRKPLVERTYITRDGSHSVVLLERRECIMYPIVAKLKDNRTGHTRQEYYTNGLKYFCIAGGHHLDLVEVNEKPPLGLKPTSIHNHERRLELLAAMQRYENSNKRIPLEWITELQALCKE